MSTDTTDRSSAQRIPSEPDTTITVTAWRDHIVESHPESHPTAVNDTLVWWTPILGPTATLMAHRLAGHVAKGGERQFTLAELARTFGMGRSSGRIRTALIRLERFRVVSVNGNTVAVRIALPPLTTRQIEQLPPYLVELYQQRRQSTRAVCPPTDTRS
jgi:hypothetical protein